MLLVVVCPPDDSPAAAAAAATHTRVKKASVGSDAAEVITADGELAVWMVKGGRRVLAVFPCKPGPRVGATAANVDRVEPLPAARHKRKPAKR